MILSSMWTVVCVVSLRMQLSTKLDEASLQLLHHFAHFDMYERSTDSSLDTSFSVLPTSGFVRV
jgi:hypothetical protein